MQDLNTEQGQEMGQRRDDGMRDTDVMQGQRFNARQDRGIRDNGMRNNSPMERARRNSQRGSDRNPYIGRTDEMRQEPYQTIGGESSLQQDTDLNSSLLGSFDTENFLKGALIGAVGAYLLTNENAQKAIFKTIVKGTQVFQAGMEEMKERFEDAKAESEADQ